MSNNTKDTNNHTGTNIRAPPSNPDARDVAEFNRLVGIATEYRDFRNELQGRFAPMC